MIVKNVEKKENNTAMLQVEIDAESFDKAINGAYKKLKGRINVPGFRKGKAPRMVIEGMFGADVFYEDAMETVSYTHLDVYKRQHMDCAIRKQVGDCVMPREGIFTVVVEEGTIKAGDKVEICLLYTSRCV